MKLRNIVAVTVASVTVAGCDLFAYDNFDPPTSVFSGEVQFNGEPVPMRGHVQNIAIWQIEPVYPNAETTSFNVAVAQDGSFRGLLFDGTYEASIESTSGPFVPNNARTRFEMRGSAEVNMAIQPYYTIQDESITYIQPTTGNPGGSISATFRVGQHDTSRALDLVGVYISPVNVVDHINIFTIATGLRERARTAIQAQLTANELITIVVPLPANVHDTPSPDRRNHVFVRIGVKPVQITERIYTDVYRIDI